MKHIVATIFLCFLGLQSLHAQKEIFMVEENTVKAPPTSRKYWLDQNEVKTEHFIAFVSGKAELLPSAMPALNTIKKYLDDKPDVTMLRVEGHCCGQGAQALSEARAKAVCQWLVKNGVDCKRVLPVGFGCTKPLTDGYDEMNGRITFVNAGLRGRAIGGMPTDGGGKVAGDPCTK